MRKPEGLRHPPAQRDHRIADALITGAEPYPLETQSTNRNCVASGRSVSEMAS